MPVSQMLADVCKKKKKLKREKIKILNRQKCKTNLLSDDLERNDWEEKRERRIENGEKKFLIAIMINWNYSYCLALIFSLKSNYWAWKIG